MAAFKFCVWFMVSAVLWLTLWARRLRKSDRQGTKDLFSASHQPVGNDAELSDNTHS
jgi:hypothetical protein